MPNGSAAHLAVRRLCLTFAVLATCALGLSVAAVPSLAAQPNFAGLHHRRHRVNQRRRHRVHRRRGARSCAGANMAVGAVSRQATKTAVVCLINAERAKHGLPALRESTLLDRSAQSWTDTMISTGVFSHGADFAARITAVGFAWTSAGENIATGFSTPRSAVDAWMGSTGHCANILNPSYTNVGTGVARQAVTFGGGGGGDTWTQDFAQAAGRSAPSHNWAPADGCPY